MPSTQQNKEAPAFYKLNYATLPDNLFQSSVPVEKWLDRCETAGSNGFAKDSLHQLSPIDGHVEFERVVGVALYMAGNVLPFAIPWLLLLAAYWPPMGQYVLMFVVAYISLLWAVNQLYCKPYFTKRYNSQATLSDTDIADNQYLYTERNTGKYLSLNVVWPKSMHRPHQQDRPLLFVTVPHGVAPFGITAYPLWSKLWNSKVCHWTAAPVVLKIPIVSYFLRKIGYIPAKSRNILETLTKKEENVGVILDGIAGMFTAGHHRQAAYLQSRKGIVKIALRAGVPLVPVYGFGHTSVYTVVVDPLGILRALSIKLDTALTPFFGRWFWFLGPPRRVPLAMCVGDPIVCPQIDEPTKEDIEKYHAAMLEGFRNVFDQHKAAYGWEEEQLEFH